MISETVQAMRNGLDLGDAADRISCATAANGWILWGLSYDQWRDVQLLIPCVLALEVVLRVMMHWDWV